MRQDIANVVNKLSKESGSLNFEVTKAYELIFDEMKETKKCVTKMKICLVNGCISIDGNIKGRVVPLIKPFCKEDPMADYYENRIYERQENYSL